MNQLLLQFAITLPVLLLSLVLHEFAHGYAAYLLGDRTALEKGRLSFNPIRHLDAFGSLVLFLTFFSSGGQMLFGWAKPVPINPRYFKSAQRGMMLVGAAGPAANLFLAAASAVVIETWLPTDELLATAILRVFQLNVILMVFNLIPVPPLDGSRILGGLLSRRAYVKWVQMDQYGPIFTMVLLVLLLGPFNTYFYEVIRSLYKLFLPTYGI